MNIHSSDEMDGTLHIPWAFPLDGVPQLPVTGEHHPLRRELARWLSWASAVTLLLVMAAFGYYLWWASRVPTEAPVMRQVKIVRYTDLGVPPSIARPSAPQINVAEAVAKIAAPPPAIAIPEPVADEKAQTRTIATVTEMAEALAPITLDDLGTGSGDGDSLVIDVDIDTSPSPEDFVVVDAEPVRISIDPPVYPSVATAAGIEGTVLVRVLVGKDGRIKDVIHIDGPGALKEAADTCARTAVFRPALVDHQPVEVWVLMPITFKLR
ncbi:MAG: energy transducer TonB [bacterium]